MQTTTNLSETAQKLLAELIKTGGAWEQSLMDAVFLKPTYPTDKNDREGRIKYWTWQANAYGNAITMSVGADHNDTMIFPGCEYKDSYAHQLSNAYQELKKAGLADERNNGFNEYWLYPTNKKA